MSPKRTSRPHAFQPRSKSGVNAARRRCRSSRRVVGCRAAVGEVIAFAELVRMRRQRMARAVHARCRELIAASVTAARTELIEAPGAERAVRLARLRKLEELEDDASALG